MDITVAPRGEMDITVTPAALGRAAWMTSVASNELGLPAVTTGLAEQAIDHVLADGEDRHGDHPQAQSGPGESANGTGRHDKPGGHTAAHRGLLPGINPASTRD